jgi:hypothetical protein
MTGEDHTSLSRGLPGLVRRAAFLHREFMAFDAERSFTEGSGTVTYVLDSDVLKAFADPHLYGPEEMPSWQEETRAKSREMRGQGQLLPRRSLALESVPAGLRDREDQRAMNVVRLLTQEIRKATGRCAISVPCSLQGDRIRYQVRGRNSAERSRSKSRGIAAGYGRGEPDTYVRARSARHDGAGARSNRHAPRSDEYCRKSNAPKHLWPIARCPPKRPVFDSGKPIRATKGTERPN